MKHHSQLANLFRKPPDVGAQRDGLEQKEREAILDLLLYCTYADNHLSLAEDKIIEQEIERFTWDSGTDIDIYINGATDRARRAISDRQARDGFLSQIRERLTSERAIERALSSMSSLFYADGETTEENVFLIEITALLIGR